MISTCDKWAKPPRQAHTHSHTGVSREICLFVTMVYDMWSGEGRWSALMWAAVAWQVHLYWSCFLPFSLQYFHKKTIESSNINWVCAGSSNIAPLVPDRQNVCIGYCMDFSFVRIFIRLRIFCWNSNHCPAWGHKRLHYDCGQVVDEITNCWVNEFKLICSCCNVNKVELQAAFIEIKMGEN